MVLYFIHTKFLYAPTVCPDLSYHCDFNTHTMQPQYGVVVKLFGYTEIISP